jgi:hypothetical protein
MDKRRYNQHHVRLQNCQISPLNFQPWCLGYKAQIFLEYLTFRPVILLSKLLDLRCNCSRFDSQWSSGTQKLFFLRYKRRCQGHPSLWWSWRNLLDILKYSSWLISTVRCLHLANSSRVVSGTEEYHLSLSSQKYYTLILPGSLWSAVIPSLPDCN